jgi:GxxExxY protein
MEYHKPTEKIIGCSFRVYNKMGFGFLESVYKNCMMIELKKADLNAEAEKQIRVTYDKEIVGEFSADILVEDMVIVELKSVRRVVQAHEIQLVNYLIATGKPIGLILNFGERKVEVKRKLKDFGKRLI